MKLMDSFGENKNSSKKEEILADIAKARIEGGFKLDTSEFEKSWQKGAELICFITPTDKRHKISAVKSLAKPTNRILMPDAPDEVKMRFLVDPDSAPDAWIQTEYKIKAVEIKPGKPIGVLARVPSFLNGVSLGFYIDALKSGTDLAKGWDGFVAVKMIPMVEFEQMMVMGGSTVKEAKETLPEDRTTPSIYKFVLAETSQPGLISKKLVRGGQETQNLLHDHNYLPLVKYETVNIGDPLPADIINNLNLAAFGDLFIPSKTTGKGSFVNLRTEDREHIWMEGGVIVSDYITNESTRVPLLIPTFYDKNRVRMNPVLPLTSQGKLIKYSLLDNRMTEREYALKTSVADPAFAHIVSISKEALSINKIRSMFKMDILDEEIEE